MIGKLIQLYRVTNDITVREFAQTLGVSPSTVSRIERGREYDQLTAIKLIVWLFQPDRKNGSP